MSLEMTMLVWAVVLALVQTVIASLGMIANVGLRVMVGNRERLPAVAGWTGRAQRAHRNMLEYLILFAILVLVTELTNANNWMTGFGAELFVGARAAYALVYIAGVPWLRTLIWSVSMAGLIIILIQLPLL